MNTEWFFTSIFWRYDYNVFYSTLLHLQPLRFHCVGGCWILTLGLLHLLHRKSSYILIQDMVRAHPLLARSLQQRGKISSATRLQIIHFFLSFLSVHSVEFFVN